jgi:hypothetical protein
MADPDGRTAAERIDATRQAAWSLIRRCALDGGDLHAAGEPDGCPSGSRIGRQLGGPQVGSEDFIADSGRRHTAV